MDRYQKRMKMAQQLRREADEMMLDATVELNQSSTQLLCTTNTIQTDVERTVKVLNKDDPEFIERRLSRTYSDIGYLSCILSASDRVG